MTNFMICIQFDGGTYLNFDWTADSVETVQCNNKTDWMNFIAKNRPFRLAVNPDKVLFIQIEEKKANI